MTYIDRFLVKFAPLPARSTDKTDGTPARKNEAIPPEELTKPTEPSFAGFVSTPEPEGLKFRDHRRPPRWVRVRGRRGCLACRPGKDCRVCEELTRNGWYASHYCGRLEWRRRRAADDGSMQDGGPR